MKKSFFGFSAKVAMAVLAVCSFVLTSCYEKNPAERTPSEYYVVGTVYGLDAETGEAVVLNGAKVTLDGATVSNPFNHKLSGYSATVTVKAEAAGYIAAEKVVKIDKVHDYNTVSTTNADLVLVPVAPEADPVLELAAEKNNGLMTAEEVAAAFSIEEGEVSVGEYVQVHTHYCLDSDLHANVHMNFHANHANGVTSEPYLVKDVHYIGYIADFSAVAEAYAVEAQDAATVAINSKYVGASYADFADSAIDFYYLLNENGESLLAGYCVCRSFNLWTLTYTLDGEPMKAYALESVNTTAQAITGADSHDNHGNGHDNHNNHTHSGATAWGGGSSVEGE